MKLLPRQTIAVMVMVLSLACACTPIDSVRESPDAPGFGVDNTAGLPEPGTRAEQPKVDANGDVAAQAGAACTVEHARSCAGRASQTPIVCEDGHWRERPFCEPDERCDTAPGPEQGRCRPIAPECMNRVPGVEFCDAMQQRRICPDLVESQLVPCGALERCIGEADRVRCACIPGAIDGAHGCEMAQHCELQNGGCDPQTKCTVVADKRACEMCPPGYSGTGETGCAPQITSLTLSAGTLTPAFNPAVHAYTVALPFLADSVAVSVNGPAETTLELNGAQATLGVPWQTPPVQTANHTLEIVLKSRFDVASSYTLALKRAPLTEAAILKANNAATTDVFGYAVALFGNTAAIGAVYEDENGSNSGAVYIFERKGARWLQQQVLRSDKPLAGECFGSAVAISEDTIVVGAVHDSPCSADSSLRGGAAYIFRRDKDLWVSAGQLTGTNGGAPGDGFGSSVAIERDTLVVGAMFADLPARDAGAAYVFTRAGGSWTPLQTLTAAQPAASAHFGTVVGLRGDTLVSSAWTETSDGLAAAGAAYVFTLDGGRWVPQTRLQARAAEPHGAFGYSVALAKDKIAIGAPHFDDLSQDTPRGQVVLFERMGGQWRETVTLQAPNPRTHDLFGQSVGLVDRLLAVGAAGDNSGARGIGGDPLRTDSSNSGALHLFELGSGNEWQPTSFIKASNADRNDNFGCSIAMSESGLIISANGEASSGPGNAADNSALASGAVYAFQ